MSTDGLDAAWSETRALLTGHQRLMMFSDQSGVSYVQVLAPDPMPPDDDDGMHAIITVVAYPEHPDLPNSSWVDALRQVRERLAALKVAP